MVANEGVVIENLSADLVHDNVITKHVQGDKFEKERADLISLA